MSGKYYRYDSNTNEFIVLNIKPYDWDTNYASYYEAEQVKIGNSDNRNDSENTYNYRMTRVGLETITEANKHLATVVGLKDCKLRRTFDMPYDITGYVDKDVENVLFKYRVV